MKMNQLIAELYQLVETPLKGHIQEGSNSLLLSVSAAVSICTILCFARACIRPFGVTSEELYNIVKPNRSMLLMQL